MSSEAERRKQCTQNYNNAAFIYYILISSFWDIVVHGVDYNMGVRSFDPHKRKKGLCGQVLGFQLLCKGTKSTTEPVECVLADLLWLL